MQYVPTEKATPVGAWFWMILATIYLISPLDIVPDFIPVAGQADDFLIFATAILNLIQKSDDGFLANIAGMLKWLLIGVGLIVVLLLFLAGYAIVGMFS